MIKVNYTELDGPAGPTCRLEASGHAGYAPAGQDIVCAGASTLMQTLCALLAGEEGAKSGAWDEPDGPPGGERHQPRRRSRHPRRCGQHDPRPARGTGTPCDARSEDQFLKKTSPRQEGSKSKEKKGQMT